MEQEFRDSDERPEFEVERGQRNMFDQLFRFVTPELLAETESLQGLAKSFGYSVTVRQSTVSYCASDDPFDMDVNCDNRNSLTVLFERAL